MKEKLREERERARYALCNYRIEETLSMYFSLAIISNDKDLFGEFFKANLRNYAPIHTKTKTRFKAVSLNTV